MGWKTPGSVAALDSGSGFAVGSVNTYTDNPTGPLGSPLHTAAGFQFPDGISGDTPASLINTAYYAAQGGNALTEQGGTFSLDSGSYNGVKGPDLNLAVRSAPAGGYAPVAEVTHAGTIGLPDDSGWTSYTCRVRSNGSGPSDPNGTMIARYKAMGTRCTFRIWHLFGTGYVGGTGFLQYDLPFQSGGLAAGGSDEQFALLRSYIGGNNYVGWGYIPGRQSFVFPYGPTSSTQTPLVAIPANIAAGSIITICGTYETLTPNT